MVSIYMYTNSTFLNNKSGGTIHSTGFNGYISLRNVLVSASAASKRVLGTLVYCETYIHTENVSLIAYNNTETSPIFIYSSRSRLTRLTTIKGITLSCQVGNKVEYLINTKSRIVTYMSLFCKPCGTGKYNLKHGQDARKRNKRKLYRHCCTEHHL